MPNEGKVDAWRRDNERAVEKLTRGDLAMFPLLDTFRRISWQKENTHCRLNESVSDKQVAYVLAKTECYVRRTCFCFCICI